MPGGSKQRNRSSWDILSSQVETEGAPIEEWKCLPAPLWMDDNVLSLLQVALWIEWQAVLQQEVAGEEVSCGFWLVVSGEREDRVCVMCMFQKT